jgi:hypothetical protein
MTDTDKDFLASYPKINGLYIRDDKGKFVFGQFARPEFEWLYGMEWLWTEKVDGTNIRLGYEPDHFRGNEIAYIAGRTDKAQIPQPLLDNLVELQQNIPWEDHFDGPVTLYGEGYGTKIQNGGATYGGDPRFVLFDVKVGPWWLEFSDVEDVGRKLGIPVVPLLFKGPINRAENTVINPTFKSAWGEFTPEGVVGRPPTVLFNKKGERVLCKVKVKDYTRV